MIAQFLSFAAASTYAQDLAASSNQVIGVFPHEDQWGIERLDEDPAEWMDLIIDDVIGPGTHSIDSFFEYQAANDASFI